jgi:5,10-methenyltetrahydrofolate synthetase
VPELLALEPEGSALVQRWKTLSLAYPTAQGLPELREEIARGYERTRADDIVVMAPQEGIFLAMLALLRPGDRVVCAFPAYQSLFEVARSVGCEVTLWEPRNRPVEKGGGYFFCPDDLAALVGTRAPGRDDGARGTRAVVCNFPHNPTGALPTPDEWSAMVGTCDRAGCWLFSDEMYRGLEHAGPARTLPAACDVYERGVSLGGVSKALSLPGARIGWLAFSPDQRGRRDLANDAVGTVHAAAKAALRARVKRALDALPRDGEAEELRVPGAGGAGGVSHPTSASPPAAAQGRPAAPEAVAAPLPPPASEPPASEPPAEQSRAVLARLREMPEYRACASASVYLPMARGLAGEPSAPMRAPHIPHSHWAEVDTWPIVEDLLARGARVAVPRVANDAEKGAMEMIRVRSAAEARSFAPSRWGIPQPSPQQAARAGGDVSATEPFDLVLVPGTAFDADGGRLGHGGGFYDRFVAAQRSNAGRTNAGRAPPTCVGLALSPQIVDGVPTTAGLDEALDAVVRPEGVLRTRGGDERLVEPRNAVLERVLELKDYTTICASAPSELLALVALRHRETLLARSLGILREGLAAVRGLAERRPDVFEWAEPEGGPFAFPRLTQRFLRAQGAGGARAYCDRLARSEDAGIMLLPSTLYFAGDDRVRLTFARKDCAETVALWERAGGGRHLSADGRVEKRGGEGGGL